MSNLIPSPDSLLDGTPSTALSPLQSAALAAVEEAWHEAGRLATLAKNYSRAATGAKALCGIKLAHLRTHYFGERKPQGGRPKKTPNDLGFSTWPDLLADRVGISDECAANWMKMGEAVAMIADNQGTDLREIIVKLPWNWTPEEAAALEAAVHKITDGKSQKDLLNFIQSDFLSDLGYVAPERPNGSNNPAGKNGGKKKPASNPQALLEERRAAARIAFLGTDKPGRVEQGSVALFMTHFVNEAGQELEALPQAELRDLYEHTVKPFAAVFRKLAGL
jgi:hypothetical protein